jgi:hypothetical protein
VAEETEQSPEQNADPAAGEAAAPGASEPEAQTSAEGGDPEAPAAAEPLGPVVSEALERIAGVLRVRGRAALEAGAHRARKRLDLFQARRDLDKLYQKLGREVVRLVEAGEVSHPGLVKGTERIRRQEEAVAAAVEAARQAAVERAAGDPGSGSDAPAEGEERDS